MKLRIVVALLLGILGPAVARAEAPPMQSHTLKNGLEVIVVENHALPLVTVEIAARNGSMTEPPDYNGLSHLYEHMFFKANAALPNQEAYMARARELGMVWNGQTQTERVNYFFTTTSDHARDAMVFMRDAIVSPRFDPKELERERVVVTGEIDRNEASPFYHLGHAVDQRVWWKYPSYKDPLGNRATVLGATPEKMRTIQKRYYVPNNSVLVIVGDVQPADIFAQAQVLYAGWKRGPDPFVKYPLVKHPPIARSEVVHVEQPVQTVNGQIVWHGPSTVGPDIELTYAADVLSTIINEPSSKFQKDLVDSGACVRVFQFWFTQVNTGPINVIFEASPDKADACVQAIVAELPKIKAPDYFTDVELHSAVHRLEVQDALQREQSSQLSHMITFWWASAGLDYYRGYIEHCRKTTRADMNRYLDSYVLGKPFVFGAMVSPQMAKDGHLDKAHFEALLGLAPAKKEGSR